MKWRASMVAADSNTVLPAVIPAHRFFHHEEKPAALGGQLLLRFTYRGAFGARQISTPARLGGDAAAVGHPAISSHAGAMPDDGTCADACMAPDVHPVTDDGSVAHAHRIPNDGPLSHLGPAIDPTAVTHPGAGSYPRVRLNVRHWPQADGAGYNSTAAHEAPAIFVPVVVHHCPGVVLE
jgi:hypothetical protein